MNDNELKEGIERITHKHFTHGNGAFADWIEGLTELASEMTAAHQKELIDEIKKSQQLRSALAEKDRSIQFLAEQSNERLKRADEKEAELKDADILLGEEWRRSVQAVQGDPEKAREHRIAALVADLAEKEEKLAAIDKVLFGLPLGYEPDRVIAIHTAIELMRREQDRLKELGKGFERDCRKHFEQGCINLRRAETAESALAGKERECEELRAKADAEMERVKACEHIAELRKQVEQLLIAMGWLEGYFINNIDGGGRHGCPWCYKASNMDKPWCDIEHTPDCVIGKALQPSETKP